MCYGNTTRFAENPCRASNVPPAAVLQKRIARIMRRLRQTHPLPPAKYSEGGFFRIPVTIGGLPHEMPLGFVGSKGCRWASSGGCSMCDYGGFEGDVPDDLLIGQARELLDSWPGETEINLSSLGSFFDDGELSPGAREGILKEVAKRPQIELLGVESRADHVTTEKVARAKEILGQKRCLEVGMGLESVDDFVRNVCVNKGLSLECFERAVQVVSANGAEPVAHVLFKPPFLEEREAAEDAAATLSYLDELGIVRRIVVMVCNVKKGTLVGELHGKGLYRPPWLWSVLKTALECSAYVRKKLLIYGFRCGLPMEAVGRNCPRCTDKIQTAIHAFCGNGRIELLKKAWDAGCECKTAWHSEFDSLPELPLPQRVDLWTREIIDDLGISPSEAKRKAGESCILWGNANRDYRMERDVE